MSSIARNSRVTTPTRAGRIQIDKGEIVLNTHSTPDHLAPLTASAVVTRTRRVLLCLATTGSALAATIVALSMSAANAAGGSSLTNRWTGNDLIVIGRG